MDFRCDRRRTRYVDSGPMKFFNAANTFRSLQYHFDRSLTLKVDQPLEATHRQLFSSNIT